MLLSCGSNSFSHLALGHDQDTSTLRPTIGTPRGEILDLVSVSAHSLLLIRNDGRNTLYGIGTNTVGQLGRQCALRDEEDVQVFKEWRRLYLIQELEGAVEKEEDWEPILVGATWTTSIVVYRRTSSSQAKSSENATVTEYMVVSCGSNDFNELGYTDIASSSTVPITKASPCPRIVDLGSEPGDKVEKLACGQRHVMLLVSDKEGSQRIIGWGAGRRGEFDLSTLGGMDGSETIGGAKGKGKGKGKATARPTTYPPTTLYLPLDGENERITEISLGASHTLVLTSKNLVFGWGSNQKGQISSTGSEDLFDITQISASWGGSYFLTSTGEILSQGSNTYSQLLHSKEGRAAITVFDKAEGWMVEKIVAGSEHLLVMMRRGEETSVWSGGWNEHGNLGLGDQRDRAELVRIGGLPEGTIKNVWGGCASTWVW